ncbi:hypothetical protein L915_07006 [Phytophthora nicotianae]|uniref:Uncharacterized protein n=1 Tax=Phytophthora nicotianae TaxID=4792 RepID=W2H0N3_PHYNI|nr:hypothetical protein L915_07006 [Phytophthora nicotianae]
MFTYPLTGRVIRQDGDGKSVGFTLNGNLPTFVTPDNFTRQAINNLFVKETAYRLPKGQYPVRVVANFKGKLNGLSRSDIEIVMSLPDNKFGRMAPYLDLVPGMPIQITQNVRAEKLAANGTLGTLEKIIYQPGTAFRLVCDGVSGVIVKIPHPPPEAIIVRIPRGPLAKSIASDIDSDLFPLFYTSEPYKPCDLSLPLSPSGEPRKLSVKIGQFPLVCPVGSTIYKVQGETLEAMVVTEWRSQIAITNKKEQPYLLVSRVTSRNAFATLEPITPEIVAWAHPSKEALEEEARLKVLSAKTVAAMDTEDYQHSRI